MTDLYKSYGIPFQSLKLLGPGFTVPNFRAWDAACPNLDVVQMLANPAVWRRNKYRGLNN